MARALLVAQRRDLADITVFEASTFGTDSSLQRSVQLVAYELSLVLVFITHPLYFGRPARAAAALTHWGYLLA